MAKRADPIEDEPQALALASSDAGEAGKHYHYPPEGTPAIRTQVGTHTEDHPAPYQVVIHVQDTGITSDRIDEAAAIMQHYMQQLVAHGFSSSFAEDCCMFLGQRIIGKLGG